MKPLSVVLGTAQLGNAYGYANSEPALEYSVCRDIVHTAYLGGIRHFDTAIAYGPALEYLQRALKEIEATEAKIISKTSPFDDGIIAQDMLYAVLSHGFVPEGLNKVEELKDIKLGCSLDLPIQVYQALDMDWIDILQVPYNMQQTDMLRPIQAAQEKGVEVMVRSIMMQGKLFDFGLTVRECMDFVHTTLPDCMQVIGAETVEQVIEICEIAREWENGT